jgi:hypothetical protein
VKQPPYYRDKEGVEWGSSQEFVEASDFVLRSLAKFLGRESEYERFVELRKMVALKMNDPAAPKVDYNEYLQSIPLWVKAMEEPLFKMYKAGLKDGHSKTTRNKKRKKSKSTV